MPSGAAPSASAPTFVGRLWPSRPDPRLSALRAGVLMVLGTLLLAISAKVQVPFYPVPMTMQTLVVLLIGATYGARLGGATVLLYLAEGLAGLPVFAGPAAGPAYMAGPTGGFLVGFAAAAFVTGWLAENGWNRGLPRTLAMMIVGHAVIFAFGLGWLATLMPAAKAWAVGAAPFMAATILKTALAAAVLQGAAALTRR
jgi:biotin transport system substrate-specific component